MSSILKRLCRNKKWLGSLEQMAGTPFQIVLLDGKVLWGTTGEQNALVNANILDGEETIGFLRASKACVQALTDIFNHFVQQEQEKRRLGTETLDRYKELTMLYHSAEQFAAVMDPHEIAVKVAREIQKIVPGDGVSFFLLGEQSLVLEQLYSSGDLPAPTIVLGAGLLGQIAQNEHGEIVNDLEADARFANELAASSLLCVPMRLKEQLIGLVCVYRKEPYQYTAADLKLVSVLAFQCSTAIENARLYEKLKLSYQELEGKQQELAGAYKSQTEFGFLFTSIVLIISLYTFLVGLFNVSSDHNSVYAVQFTASRLLELAVLGLVIIIIVKSGMPLKGFGVTLRGWQAAITEAVAISLPIMILMVVAKYWLVRNTTMFADSTLFLWSNFNFSYVTYIVVAPLQEFVTRGVFQTTIERLLVGHNSHFWAIANTSFVFGALHLHSSLNLAIAAFVTSWLWGFMYARQRTLVGVSISHFLLGNFADLLGFWSFF